MDITAIISFSKCPSDLCYNPSLQNANLRINSTGVLREINETFVPRCTNFAYIFKLLFCARFSLKKNEFIHRINLSGCTRGY